MTHKHKLGDAKEQINRRLAEFDDRYEITGMDSIWASSDSIAPAYNPDYCSSDSPRSLLEGIEAQLDKRQFHDFYMALRNLVYPPHALTTGDTSQRGMICATAEQKARAIYAILEKE